MMQERALMDRIRARSAGLSRAHRLIAEYILSNNHRAAFMTASKLGARVGVSESTVVRFARALGYEGYPQLQHDLQETLRARLTTADRLELSLEGGEDDETVLDKVLKMDMENIRATLAEVSRPVFHRVVDQLIAARRVVIIGLRSSSSLAHYLDFYLGIALSHVQTLHDAGDFFEQLININGEDLVLALSFPRYSRLTLEAVEYARRRGAATVVITDSALAPVASVADLVLVSKCDLASFADSLAAPLSLANALITAVGYKQRDRVKKTLEELEEIWKRHHVYISNGRGSSDIRSGWS